MELLERNVNTSFPLSNTVQSPQFSTAEKVAAFKRPTILIFEESHEMQEHYKQFLRSDYNLLMVETARYGIQMLQSLPVDVILLNIEQNREVEAVSMLKIFRRIAAGASIPVIAMTGYSGSEERSFLQKARFDAYLPRPFTLQKLREVITRCMARRTFSVLNGMDLSLFSV